MNVLKWTDLPWNLPVHCDKPGCEGTMTKNMIEQPNNETQLHYKCLSCDYVYATTIQSKPTGDDKDINIPGQW